MLNKKFHKKSSFGSSNVTSEQGKWLGEIQVDPPPSQYTVVFGNQIFLPIFYYINSKVVTILKVIDTPLYVPNIFYLIVSFKFLNLALRYSFFLFLKCLLASRLTVFRLSTELLLGFCKHCNFACSLLSKKSKCSSSNHGLRCINSYRNPLN